MFHGLTTLPANKSPLDNLCEKDRIQKIMRNREKREQKEEEKKNLKKKSLPNKNKKKRNCAKSINLNLNC